MHPNRTFAWTDAEEMLAFVAETAFSTIMFSADGALRVVHVPVVVAGPNRLHFHLSRANSAAAHMDGAELLLSCVGPDAYISPDWYGSPDQVPTWNYIAVECEGKARRLGDEELIAQLDRLSEVHEAKLMPKRPWTRRKMAAGRFETMLRGILGFEIEIGALRGTRKLGQHKKKDEVEGVASGLAGAGKAAMAELTRAEISPK
jgi:transcriptional regulator